MLRFPQFLTEGSCTHPLLPEGYLLTLLTFSLEMPYPLFPAPDKLFSSVSFSKPEISFSWPFSAPHLAGKPSAPSATVPFATPPSEKSSLYRAPLTIRNFLFLLRILEFQNIAVLVSSFSGSLKPFFTVLYEC